MKKSSYIFIVVAIIAAEIYGGTIGRGKQGRSNGLGEECRDEQYRPQLHFSVPSHWMNDPNGLVYYKGEYHLHYQYYPHDVVWGPMHWGHAVTTDLVTWTDLPIAFYPDDEGDIFSGSAVVDFDNTTGFQKDPDDHPIVAIFTQGRPGFQQQSIAYSLNRARTYTKYEADPVLTSPGEYDFRDPKVFRYDGKWIMSLAVGNKIQFYRSDDLKSWEFLSEFGDEPGQGSHGGVWECPDLIQIELNDENYWVLLVSINPGGPNGGSATQYFIGDFDGKNFTSNQMEPLWMDWGPDNYAGVTFFNDPKGRHLVMSWLNNWDYANEIPTKKDGFNGIMTLPRELSLDFINGSARLVSSLTEEFDKLRDPFKLYGLRSKLIPHNGEWNVSEQLRFRSPLMEVNLAFEIGYMEGNESISICFVNDLGDEVCTGYDNGAPREQAIFLHRGRSGNNQVFGPLQSATAERIRENTMLRFQIVMDVSAMEVFVDNGFTTLTSLHFSNKPLDTLVIRHRADSPYGGVSLILGSVQGLRSIYDCSN